jgi:hypothetical protein
MKCLLLVFLLNAIPVFAVPSTHTSWNGLSATWTYLPNKGFDEMPRQLSEKHDFVLKDNLCNGGKFRGQRYWSNSDPALMLLFDKNGIIAGMQTSAPKSKFTPLPGSKGFVDDGDLWTQTVYFVEPSTICKTGRTKEELEKDGTGTGLWIQHGPDPTKNVINLPLNEEEIKKTKWGSGRCFPTMGQHYWFDLSSDMNCKDFFPTCLLYNGNKLTGFCFAKNVNLESPHYDVPRATPSGINATMNPVPKCFFSEPSFQVNSAIHVYFHKNPRDTSNC